MLHFGKIGLKSRKKLVKFGEISANFWQNFGKKQQKIQQFLTKILRLESGALAAVFCQMSLSQGSSYFRFLFSL